jgi:hypothetical protein
MNIRERFKILGAMFYHDLFYFQLKERCLEPYNGTFCAVFYSNFSQNCNMFSEPLATLSYAITC